MAENRTPSFAVDADITPLQGRYFQYAQSRISDPRVREQAYGLIKQTFGDIQQARDAQRIRQQEEEERALTMDVKRAQLDEGRLQLSMARDKFRRQQEAAQIGGGIYSTFDAIRQDPNTRPEEKIKQIYDIAAQNSDFFSGSEMAQNKLNNTLNAVKALKISPDISVSQASRLISEGVSPEAFARLGLDPNNPVYKDLFEQRKVEAGEKTLKKEKEAAETQWQITDKAMKIAEDSSEAIKELGETIPGKGGDKAIQATPPSNVDWTKIDNALLRLNNLNLVSDEDKKALENVGIRTFNPDAAPVKGESADGWTQAKYLDLRKKQYKTVNSIINKASRGEQQPTSKTAQPAQTGFSVSGAVPLAPR